jgi:1-aminocyclopropane-1-carboxylate deaminase/D-cysteine desulfhydrase-like pyridoxal-dependent ACC family enzyme
MSLSTIAFLAPGYGRLNDAAARAIALGARTEALMLDPVYSGKALAGALAMAAETWPRGDRAVPPYRRFARDLRLWRGHGGGGGVVTRRARHRPPATSRIAPVV